MNSGKMDEGDKQEQVTQGKSVSDAEAEEEDSDQGEVMYEDDILEEVEDNALPENGLHTASFWSQRVHYRRVFVSHMQGWVLRWRILT